MSGMLCKCRWLVRTDPGQPAVAGIPAGNKLGYWRYDPEYTW